MSLKCKSRGDKKAACWPLANCPPQTPHTLGECSHAEHNPRIKPENQPRASLEKKGSPLYCFADKLIDRHQFHLYRAVPFFPPPSPSLCFSSCRWLFCASFNYGKEFFVSDRCRRVVWRQVLSKRTTTEQAAALQPRPAHSWNSGVQLNPRWHAVRN